jgi:hypothetical protein
MGAQHFGHFARVALGVKQLNVGCLAAVVADRDDPGLVGQRRRAS